MIRPPAARIRRLLGILVALAVLLGLTAAAGSAANAAITHGAAVSAQAQARNPAITFVQDESYDGDGFFLNANDAVGATVTTGTAGNNSQWGYISVGSGYYEITTFMGGLCVTASTTQYGVVKIEKCVAGGASQQYWYNPNSSGRYRIQSDYWGLPCLASTTATGNANVTFESCLSYGNNSTTWKQTIF